jgi:hypothetical protein
VPEEGGIEMKTRMARCRGCFCLNYNFIRGEYEMDAPYFCGQHGCARVDPDGEQRNLDNRGSCGFWPKVDEQPRQLEFKYK